MHRRSRYSGSGLETSALALLIMKIHDEVPGNRHGDWRARSQTPRRGSLPARRTGLGLRRSHENKLGLTDCRWQRSRRPDPDFPTILASCSLTTMRDLLPRSILKVRKAQDGGRLHLGSGRRSRNGYPFQGMVCFGQGPAGNLKGVG